MHIGDRLPLLSNGHIIIILYYHGVMRFFMSRQDSLSVLSLEPFRSRCLRKVINGLFMVFLAPWDISRWCYRGHHSKSYFILFAQLSVSINVHLVDTY